MTRVGWTALELPCFEFSPSRCFLIRVRKEKNQKFKSSICYFPDFLRKSPWLLCTDRRVPHFSRRIASSARWDKHNGTVVTTAIIAFQSTLPPDQLAQKQHVYYLLRSPPHRSDLRHFCYHSSISPMKLSWTEPTRCRFEICLPVCL